jgi:hypothetical protein
MTDVCRLKYTAGTPTDSDTFILFSTYDAGLGGNFFSHAFTTKFEITIKNSQIGTLKEYRSDDGITWTQISETAVAIPAASASNTYPYDVGQYKHWKLVWVNGGTTQTTFTVDMVITGEQL